MANIALKRKACFGFFWLLLADHFFPIKKRAGETHRRGDRDTERRREAQKEKKRRRGWNGNPPAPTAWQSVTTDVSIGNILQPPVANSNENTPEREKKKENQMPGPTKSPEILSKRNVFIKLTANNLPDQSQLATDWTTWSTRPADPCQFPVEPVRNGGPSRCHQTWDDWQQRDRIDFIGVGHIQFSPVDSGWKSEAIGRWWRASSVSSTLIELFT